jgi:hypothetical protein
MNDEYSTSAFHGISGRAQNPNIGKHEYSLIIRNIKA